MVCDLFVLSPGKMLYGFLVVDSIFSWQEKARGPRINSKNIFFFWGKYYYYSLSVFARLKLICKGKGKKIAFFSFGLQHAVVVVVVVVVLTNLRVGWNVESSPLQISPDRHARAIVTLEKEPKTQTIWHNVQALRN